MEQKNIDKKEIEVVYKPTIDYTKKLIVDIIRYETERILSEVQAKDFFDSFNNENEILEFTKMSKENKLELIIQWVRDELWFLEDEIYDIAESDFDFEMPE